jgi:hypothetical protein
VAPLFGRLASGPIVTFALFGLLTVASRRLSPVLAQDRWPRLLNLGLNAVLVAASFHVGFRVDAWIG